MNSDPRLLPVPLSYDFNAKLALIQSLILAASKRKVVVVDEFSGGVAVVDAESRWFSP